MSLLELKHVTVEAGQNGLKICGSVEVAGRMIPVCVPERYTEWEDVLRLAIGAGKIAESLWKRLWRRLAGS